MVNPIFKVKENRKYELEEMLTFIWEQNSPLILALASVKYPEDIEENRYVILNSVNMTTGTIGVKDPADTVTTDRKIALEELITTGYEYSKYKHQYLGTNIICEY